MRRAVLLLAGLIAIGALIFVALGGPTGPGPGPTASPSSGPTPSPTTSPTPTPTPSPTPSPSPSPSPTPSPTPEPTPTVFRSADGYAITLPVGWLALPVEDADVDALLDLLGSQQPAVADLVRDYLELTNARISMVALEGGLGGTGSALPANVNVLIQPSLGLSLSFVSSLVGSVIEELPGVTGPVTTENVSLPAGEAARLRFQVQVDTEGVTVPATALESYILIRGSEAYVITFVSAADQVGDDQPVFEEIIGSLCFDACPSE